MTHSPELAQALQMWPRIGPSRTRPARRGMHPISTGHPRLFGPLQDLLGRLGDQPRLRQQLLGQTVSAQGQPPDFGALRSLALACLLTDDPTAKSQLTRQAIAAAGLDPAGLPTETLVRLIQTAAIAFDCLSPSWSQSQRDQVLAGLRRLLAVFDATDGPHWHGPLCHLHLQRLAAIGLAGYATYPHNPLALQWIERARDFEYESVLVPALVEWLANGGWAEPAGQELLGIGYLYDWMQIAQQVEGYDAVAAVPDWHRAHMLHLVFAHPASRRPDAHRPDELDALHRAVGVLLDYFEILSDPIAGALADSFRTQLQAEAASAGITLLSRRQRCLPSRSDNLANSHVEPYLGQVYVRGGWQADALALRSNCGPHLITAQPLANGSFELSTPEEFIPCGENILLLASGEYPDGRQSATWGVDGALRERPVAVEELPASHDVGRLVGFQDEGRLVYVAGRYEGAYQHARARRVFRQWVLLRPDLVVIFDRAECTSAVTAVRWQLHLRGQLHAPQPDAADWSVQGKQGRLLARTVLPAAHRWQGEPIGTRSLHRVLIEPAEHSSEVMFLHVMTTGGALPNTQVRTTAQCVELQIGEHRLEFFLQDPISARAHIGGRTFDLEYREPNEIYGLEGPSII